MEKLNKVAHLSKLRKQRLLLAREKDAMPQSPQNLFKSQKVEQKRKQLWLEKEKIAKLLNRAAEAKEKKRRAIPKPAATIDIFGVMAIIHYYHPPKTVKVNITNIKVFLAKYLPLKGNTRERKKIQKEHTKLTNIISKINNCDNDMIMYKTTAYYTYPHTLDIEIRRGSS